MNDTTPLPSENVNTNHTEEVCKQYFISKSNDMKVLFAMAIGIPDKDGNIVSSFDPPKYPTTSKKMWHPQRIHLIDEIERSKMLTKDYTKTNKQWSKHKAVEWLVNNPVTADIDVSFLRRRLKSFIEEANAASTTSSNYWVGSVPFLRLIHCLVDFENIKEAFLKSFESMSRQELDGRFNDNIRRESPWLLIADKWNDSDYNPTSTPYVTLHQDFQTAIDLSFDKVKNMGELTPDSAKARFFKMKNDLLVIKNAWELSGNGDGGIGRGAEDTVDN